MQCYIKILLSDYWFLIYTYSVLIGPEGEPEMVQMYIVTFYFESEYEELTLESVLVLLENNRSKYVFKITNGLVALCTVPCRI